MLVAAVPAAAAGCGGEPAPRPRPPVQLALTAPLDGDTTRAASIAVSGSVSPAGSRVIVLGEPVVVRGGAFSTRVELREGPNLIDVGASAAGRRAVWRALRVTRRSKVRVPRLVGRPQDEAVAALARAGLEARVRNDDDLLDAFRRGPRIVCGSDPEADAEVAPGTAVQLVVSKGC